MSDERGVVKGRIDIGSLVAEVPSGEWHNEVLTSVNDAVVRLGVIEGEYHWHTHPGHDEFFLTLDGQLHLEIVDGDGSILEVILTELQGFTVPAGVEHRTRAPGRTAILMVDAEAASPEGEISERHGPQ